MIESLYEILIKFFDIPDQNILRLYYYICGALLFIYEIGLVNITSNNMRVDLGRSRIGFIFSFPILFGIQICMAVIAGLMIIHNVYNTVSFLVMICIAGLINMLVIVGLLLSSMVFYELSIRFNKRIFDKWIN